MAEQLHDLEETGAMLGNLGRTKVFELIKTRQLDSVKIGRRRLVPDSAIDRYVAQLQEANASS